MTTKTNGKPTKTGNKPATVTALQKAYSMEMETVANYLAGSVNLDGVMAEEIKNTLATEVTAELDHARRLARRIKQLQGHVPGPTDIEFTHSHMEAGDSRTDVESVIRAVIADETAATEHYRKIIEDTEGTDYVTQDLCIELLGDEEEHLTLFQGFLKDFKPQEA
jgi:bacterioferritin